MDLYDSNDFMDNVLIYQHLLHTFEIFSGRWSASHTRQMGCGLHVSLPLTENIKYCCHQLSCHSVGYLNGKITGGS